MVDWAGSELGNWAHVQLCCSLLDDLALRHTESQQSDSGVGDVCRRHVEEAESGSEAGEDDEAAVSELSTAADVKRLQTN